MKIADLIRSMAAAGAPIEAIALAVEAIEVRRPVNQLQDRTPGAERQARYRARLSGVEVVTVTQSDDVSDVRVTASDASLPPPMINNSTPPSSLRSERQSERNAWFSEIWLALPKRTGSNPKQPAEEKFYRLIKSSDDPTTLAAEILDGARRYAASVRGADPRFTAQAVTWFNQGRWKDDYSRPVGPMPRAGPAPRPPPRNNRIAAVNDLLDSFHERSR